MANPKPFKTEQPTFNHHELTPNGMNLKISGWLLSTRPKAYGWTKSYRVSIDLQLKMPYDVIDERTLLVLADTTPDTREELMTFFGNFGYTAGKAADATKVIMDRITLLQSYATV